MFELNNVVCEVHYVYYENPDEIVFKVLHNNWNVKDIPWPYLHRAGLRGRVHLTHKQTSQSDYLHRQDSTYLSNSLWTCKCDPRETGVFIHVKSASICINCKQWEKDATPRLKYFRDIFPHEIKNYKFNEKESLDNLIAHWHEKQRNEGASNYLH